MEDRRVLPVALAGLACVALLLAVTAARAQNLDAAESWRDAQQELANLGTGLVVWESNRTGAWRIWIQNLDGSGPRQLSPDEEGREHYAPHISPDGRSVVYISYPKGAESHRALRGQKAPLRLIGVDGRGLRQIAENARTYGGNRSAVWLDAETLIYIDGDGATREMNVNSGASKALTSTGHSENGWLLNATKTHATRGHPAQFALYDAATLSIAERPAQGGCEAFLSADGVWGYWMADAGGPISRIRLSTGEISPIIQKDDPRMPAGRQYLYFPNLSPDGRLITFAASPNQHDHNTGDYDVFVAQTNPTTLDIIGRPVRYTFHAGVDRYPDVFLAPLALGQHDGEAPFAVDLRPSASEGQWEWDFGDGSRARLPNGRHSYERAGEYEVTARRGETVLRGRVHVRPAEPPRATLVTVRGDREIVVVFDEPIQVERRRRARLESGANIRDWQIAETGERLVLIADRPVRHDDWLRLEGVTDRAQRPNRMPAAGLRVQRPTWPSNDAGLVFVWRTGDQPNIVPAPGLSAGRSFTLRARGRARLNHDQAMVLAGGAYLAEGADELLLNALRATHRLTLEALITPDDDSQRGPARIVTFSTDPGQRNFTLGQEGGALVFRLRTPRTGGNGTNPEVRLGDISSGEPTHVLITYEPGRLTFYRNGEKTLETDAVQGDFGNWTPHHLLVGDEWTGERDWRGTLEGIALYDRVLSAEEARQNFESYRSVLSARPQVPRATVRATLVARSRTPSLTEIRPYREALAVHEYAVDTVESGPRVPARIRVAHWVILDGAALDGRTGNGSVRLALEPFEANQQLQSVYMSDTLEPNPDIPLYYDARSVL
jgi:hypothetical protein